MDPKMELMRGYEYQFSPLLISFDDAVKCFLYPITTTPRISPVGGRNSHVISHHAQDKDKSDFSGCCVL